MCLPQPFQVVFPHTSQVVGRHMIVSFVVVLRRIVVFGTEVIMRSPPHDEEGLGLLAEPGLDLTEAVA